MNSLGERVRLLRIQSKLNMEELAAELKMPVYDKDTGKIIDYKSTSKASISNLEKGKHRPNVDMAIAIAKFFGVSLDWLLLGEGEQESNKINTAFKEAIKLRELDNIEMGFFKQIVLNRLNEYLDSEEVFINKDYLDKRYKKEDS